jgi:hypothetical protein
MPLKSSAYLILHFRIITGLIIAIIGVLTAGCGTAARGPLRPLAANPRYFTDGSGRAIFLTGSHTWPNFATDQGAAKFDYSGYLDFLAAHNLNFFRAWVWDVPYSVQGISGGPFEWEPLAYARTGPGLATDGNPKFDLTKFNQAFFDRMRERTIMARDRDIYTAIMLFQGFAWQFNRTDRDGFPLDGRNNINGVDAGPKDGAATLDHPAVTAVQEAYVRKVVDTLNDLDNVLYEITNESSPASTPWQYHFIDFIHTYERTKPRQHPVGMTYQYSGGKNSDLYESRADWISPNCEPEFLKDPPVADGSKVIVFDTDHGYGWQDLKRDGPALHRVWAWKCFLRGNHTLFMDPYLAKPPGKASPRNHPLGVNPVDPYFGLTPDPYYEPLRSSMGDTRRYAQKMNLAAAFPHGELASTNYCLADPGREYLVYNPGAEKTFTVNLKSGVYDYEWFNPTSGLVMGTGRVTAVSDNQSYTAPFFGDAVLYLKRTRG